jgi:hypothetical protein
VQVRLPSPSSPMVYEAASPVVLAWDALVARVAGDATRFSGNQLLSLIRTHCRVRGAGGGRTWRLNVLRVLPYDDTHGGLCSSSLASTGRASSCCIGATSAALPVLTVDGVRASRTTTTSICSPQQA